MEKAVPGIGTPDKSSFNLFNPTPVELRRAFNTDRPSKTDSPYTIDAGAFQIEMDVVNWTVDYRNVDHADVLTRTWLIGQTNFKVGLTNSIDLQVLLQGYINRRTSGDDFGSALEQDGFGDTTIRFKVNLWGNDSGKLAIGFISSLKSPTNTNHAGNHAFEPGFGLPVSYVLPAGFTMFAQSRIDIVEPGTGSPRLLWSNPIGVSRTIARNVSAYIEFYNAINLIYDHPWVGTVDAGLIFQVTPNFSIDINSFIGLTANADDFNLLIGFGRRF